MKINKFDIIRQDIEYHLGLLFHAFTTTTKTTEKRIEEQ